jgi:hypothetical protein
MLVQSAQVFAEPGAVAVSSCREGLESLLEVINQHGNLTEAEELTMENLLVSLLATRFQVECYVAEHPQVLEQPIERPIFVVGLPRTGTTLLSRLLSRDTARRSPLNWEAKRPVPPASRDCLTNDPRCLAQRRLQEIAIRYRPTLGRIHWEYADDPTECHEILAQDFKAGLFVAGVRVPEYFGVSGRMDVTSSYQYHRKVLQILQSNAPGTWNLKSPMHVLYIPSLLKTYPDARLIWIHRDPYRAVASFCSLWADVGRRFLGAGPPRPPMDVLELFGERARALADYDEASGGKSIYHVYYADLIRDPIAEVRRIYAWLGDSVSAEVELRMTQALEATPQHQFGKHDYSLEQFCYSVEMLEPVFSDYTSKYEVAREL